MVKYLHFSHLTFLLVFHNWFFLLGGGFMWVNFVLAILIGIVFDEWAGDDLSEPKFGHPWIFNVMLYMSLPLVFSETMIFAYYLSGYNFLYIEDIVRALFGFEMDYHRDITSDWHLLGAALSLGLSYGSSATNVAHELTHRTEKWFDVLVGRWLLAFTWDTTFAIEHVYGHHKNVGTPADPATSRRGENVWKFVVRSTVFSNISAFRFETNRLRIKGYAPWGWRNRALRGQLMSLLIAALFYAAAGWMGVAVFMAVAVYGKGYLEFVNYIEHYGLVRIPGKPVELRHSWNSNRRVSSAFLYNLTRHSYHHLNAKAPFWKIKSCPEAPTLPFGYLTMIFIAMVPPLFNRVMAPRLAEWDSRYASPEERAVLASA